MLAGPRDGVGDHGIEQSEVAVRGGGTLLDIGQGPDELREEVEPHAADMEILHGTHRLHAEIVLYGDLHLSEQVVLAAGLPRKLDVRKIHNVNFFGSFYKYSIFYGSLSKKLRIFVWFAAGEGFPLRRFNFKP